MNRIDRRNLAAMTSSLTSNEPMGLNTETGMPQTGNGLTAAASASDMTVPNGGAIIDPKPGSKFAAPEDDFGTMPVSMNRHGDIIGTESAAEQSGREGGSAPDNVIAPKPGSKFAAPEDDFGTMPVSMNRHGDIIGTESAAEQSGREGGSAPDSVIAPKPGSKFAAAA